MRAVNLPITGSSDAGVFSQKPCFNLFVTSREEEGDPCLQDLSDLILLKWVKLPIFMWELHVAMWRLESWVLIQIALVWTLRNCMGFWGFTPLRAEPRVLYLKSLSLSTGIFFPFWIRLSVSESVSEMTGCSHGTKILIWPMVIQVWNSRLGRPLCAMRSLTGPNSVLLYELEQLVTFLPASASLTEIWATHFVQKTMDCEN